MTATLPADRSQRLDALRLANQVRASRKRTLVPLRELRDYAEGRRQLAVLVVESPPELHSIRLVDLMARNAPYIGRARAGRYLRRARIGEHRRLGSLQLVEARRLAVALEAGL